MDSNEVWNAAIDAFEKRLAAYYSHQRGTTSPILVEYHVHEIAKDLRRETSRDEI